MDFERYSRNLESFSRQEVESLFDKKVCVVGCGGLGGLLIQLLARMGVGHLTIIDGDLFAPSNLNRQVFSNQESLGKPKASYTKEMIKSINPETIVTAFDLMLDEKNGPGLIRGHDLVLDALDNLSSRRLLQQICEHSNIPVVFGAIGGFYGQVTVMFPGDKTFERIYPKDRPPHKDNLGNPPFTPALISSLMATQAVKFLTGKGSLLRNKLMFVDLLNDRWEIIELE